MAEDGPTRETLGQLVERLDLLERRLRADSERLAAIERRLGLAVPDASVGAAPDTTPRAARVQPAAPADDSAAQAYGGGRGSAEAGSQRAGGAADTRARASSAFRSGRRAGPAAARQDFESLIGGSWFNWIGVVAVAFGVAFFLKLAFESDWIGPSARVMLGASAGLALLGLGERLRVRGLRQYAYVLAGGGILILYLSVYAAFNFYRLIAQPTAFLLMACVTVAAVLLAVRLDALPVAVLGLVGGFLTPLLLSTGRDNQVALFTYMALLDAGVLAVAYFRRWGSLNLLSFFATALVTFGWLVAHYRPVKLWPTLFFLSLFFVLYALIAVANNLLPRRPARWFDVLLVGANAGLYFGLGYALMLDAGFERRLPATLAVVVSSAFLLLYYAAWRLNRGDRLLAYAYAGGAVTFFTVALGIQYELYWVTIAWAVEALMLTWAGLRAGAAQARIAALFVFALAALHWLTWDLPELHAGADFVPLLNRRVLSCAVLVFALAAAARLHTRSGAGGAPGRVRWVVPALVAAANLLAVVALSAEASGYFEAKTEAARGLLPPAPTYAGTPEENAAAVAAYERASRPLRDLELARQLSLSLVWAVYGAALLVVGRVRRVRLLRLLALGLLGVTTLKVFFWDLASLDRAYRIVSFIALGLVLLAVSYLYQRGQQHSAEAAGAGV